MFNLKDIQNEIESVNEDGAITWLPLDEIVTHKFEKGVFVLLPLTSLHQMKNGTEVRVNVFAAAVQFDGSNNWRGLNLRVGLKGSPVDELRELLSQV